MPRRGLYKGYSSFEYQSKKTFALRDIELVKLDLLNHIFTRRGERVMMPGFGTQIPEMVFEPLDDITIDTVTEEVLYVINYDPRVELVEFNVVPNYNTQSITVNCLLLYIEIDTVDEFNLHIEFEGEAT